MNAHENVGNMTDDSFINMSLVKEVRDGSDCLIRSMRTFEKGGNFSTTERDAYKLRVSKLDAKLSRFETLQMADADKILPERIEKGRSSTFRRL